MLESTRVHFLLLSRVVDIHKRNLTTAFLRYPCETGMYLKSLFLEKFRDRDQLFERSETRKGHTKRAEIADTLSPVQDKVRDRERCDDRRWW